MTNEEFIQSIALPGEEWKEVPGWEGCYAVSSEGRIASIKTEFYYRNRVKPRKVKPLLMKAAKTKTTNGGYKRLIAYRNRNRTLLYVHRLVAELFVSNPRPDIFTEVDHIDGNPLNNKASNLRWVNRSGNMMNPIARERQSNGHKGQSNKCQYKPVVRISSDGAVVFYSYIRAAIADGFQQSGISSCCSGKRHTHKGFKWMYLSDYESQVSMSKNSDTNP